ncbi:hypothetical protein M422DRAFT_37369 [Sphaerobolus stellatus SS14]|uniref:Uncharacterized protein n=1 Tax=Sphaerobolus stellatus (strain SS14) TaxID=990650 RepID=A0A0C9TFV4_SPHS4|nr:hypothetical protein M422DRAFT_37369 [Sphaerobolus stellatus SS14]
MDQLASFGPAILSTVEKLVTKVEKNVSRINRFNQYTAELELACEIIYKLRILGIREIELQEIYFIRYRCDELCDNISPSIHKFKKRWGFKMSEDLEMLEDRVAALVSKVMSVSRQARNMYEGEAAALAMSDPDSIEATMVKNIPLFEETTDTKGIVGLQNMHFSLKVIEACRRRQRALNANQGEHASQETKEITTVPVIQTAA